MVLTLHTNSRAHASAEPDARRTHQKVHACSRRAGDDWQRERRTRLTRRESDRLLFLAQLYDDNVREEGSRNGALGYKGVRILEVMRKIAHRSFGIIQPSLSWIAVLARCSVSTVKKALLKLKAAGFLDWQRRYVETGEAGPVRGPQVEQTTNLYWLMVPEAAEQLADEICGPRQSKPAQGEIAAALRQLAVDADRRRAGARSIDAAIAKGQSRAAARNAADQALRRT